MMAEEALYRYTSNKDPWDTTEKIVVGADEDGNPTKVMERGGAPVLLSEEEAENAKRRFNVTKLSDERAAEYDVVDEETGRTFPKPEEGEGKSRRSTRKTAAAQTSQQPADENAGGVVDPQKGGGSGAGGTAAAAADDQGSRGATGQDVGTTTGGTR